MLRRVLLPLALGAATLAGVVHAGQIPSHAEESPPMAALFVASVGFAACWVLAVAVAPRAGWLLAAGLVGHAAMVAVGGLSRTVGLGPLEGREAPSGPWLVAMAAELLVVVCCWVLLTSEYRAFVGRLPVAATKVEGRQG